MWKVRDTDIFLAAKDYLCFCSSVNNQGTNFTEICRIFNPSSTIGGAQPTSYLKNRASSACVEDFEKFSSMSHAQGRPNAHKHRPNFLQFEKKKHPEICVLSMTLSPKTKERVSAFLMQCSRVWRKTGCKGAVPSNQPLRNRESHLTCTQINTRREAMQRVTAAKLTNLLRRNIYYGS